MLSLPSTFLFGTTETALLFQVLLFAIPLGLLTGGEKSGLGRIEILWVGLGPLPRSGQPAPGVEEATFGVIFVVRVGIRPLLRGLGQPAMDAEPGPVGVNPLAELRPAADEGLVGDLDVAGGLPLAGRCCGALRAFGFTGLNSGRGGRLAALGGDQASVGQLADDLLDSRPLSLGGDQFVERSAALGVLGPLAGLGQPPEDTAADLQLPGAVPESLDDGVGPVLERPCTPPMPW